MKKDNKIGIIGCGNMGGAIARGIISSNLIPASNLCLYDIDKEKRNYLVNTLSAKMMSSPWKLADFCTIILLAVKPQDFEDVRREIWEVLDSSKLVISIAAGITLGHIHKYLKEDVRIVRVMPNIAGIVNQGISALCYDNFTTPPDKELVRKIFMSIGDVIEVEEDHMDIVTAISGSGPAYFFYLVQILEECAIEMGIDKEKARLLAVKTALGSTALLKDGKSDAETLRKQVTSKGGTTEAAFRVFAKKKLGDILKEGIRAAKERARELSENGSR